MSKIEFPDPHAIHARVGEEIAVSDWIAIGQARVDAFADATGDHQWIHTDPERARRESPFAAPIAHGHLTLSLLPWFFQESLAVGGVRLAVNYGLNRVRFPAPVPVGSRLRARLVLLSFEDMGDSIQLVWKVTVEIEGAEKPACVAETVTRWYF